MLLLLNDRDFKALKPSSNCLLLPLAEALITFELINISSQGKLETSVPEGALKLSASLKTLLHFTILKVLFIILTFLTPLKTIMSFCIVRFVNAVKSELKVLFLVLLLLFTVVL